MLPNIESVAKSCGVFQYGEIAPADVEFSEEVRRMCEVNTCRKYGATWACPPAVGTVEECRDRARQYAHMLVINGKYDLEDSFDFEGMQDGMKAFKETCRRLEKELAPQVREYLMLSNEGCDLCESCTYPDAPCRHPDRVHGSIEGYGIFVSQLAKKLGINYINGANTVTYFGAFLYNDLSACE